MLFKKLKGQLEKTELDVDLALLEMDSIRSRIRCMSREELTDCIDLEKFDKALNLIKESYSEVMNFDDSTVMYENDGVILSIHDSLNSKVLFFDFSYLGEVERLFNSY